MFTASATKVDVQYWNGEVVKSNLEFKCSPVHWLYTPCSKITPFICCALNRVAHVAHYPNPYWIWLHHYIPKWLGIARLVPSRPQRWSGRESAMSVNPHLYGYTRLALHLTSSLLPSFSSWNFEKKIRVDKLAVYLNINPLLYGIGSGDLTWIIDCRVWLYPAEQHKISFPGVALCSQFIGVVPVLRSESDRKCMQARI